MAYIPDPTNATQPVGSVIAGTAAAEFRALKAFILGSVLPNLNNNNIWRKNFIINGDMVIDQRNEGASLTLTGATLLYSADKWVANRNTAVGHAATIRQVAGFATNDVKALKYDVTVAGIPIVTDQCFLETAIEGYDVAHLQWGTANAAPVSLSFNVKSSVAGIFSVALRNNTAARSYVTTFSIPVANVATAITINNIPGDIAGVWQTTAPPSILVSFDMGAVAAFETPANIWTAGNFSRVVGTITVGNNVMNIQFSNVQLEQAITASPFERLLFATRYALCQRYFYKTFPLGTVPAANVGKVGALIGLNGVNGAGVNVTMFKRDYPQSMRVSPTIVQFAPGGAGAGSWDYTAAALSALTTDYGYSDKDEFVYTQGTWGGGGTAASQVALHITANADFF